MLSVTGGISYLWSTGASTNSIHVTNGGNYQVAITNQCGTDTANFNLIVDSVFASFKASGTSGLVPFPVFFTDSSSANAVTWTWNFGDGATSIGNGLGADHTYGSPGTYIVQLTVTDSNGCISIFSRIIDVHELPSWLIVPNVFTPNGDGTNDEFKVKSFGIVSFDAKIYDRWGVEMAELGSAEMGWDGTTIAGLPAVNGTYFYLIKAKGADGKAYDLKGFLMLMRN